MKIGTPEANSFCAAGMELTTFHSASGVREIRRLVVAAFDRAAHHHHALELPERLGIFFDYGAHVHERPNGNQGNFAGIAAEFTQYEVDGLRMRNAFGMVATLGIRALCKCSLRRSGDSHGDGNVGLAGRGQKAVDQLGAFRRVSKCRSYAQNLQFRAA